MCPRVGDLQEGNCVVLKIPPVFKPLLEGHIDLYGVVPQSEVLAALLHCHLVRVRHPGIRRNPRLLSDFLGPRQALADLFLSFHDDFSYSSVIKEIHISELLNVF